MAKKKKEEIKESYNDYIIGVDISLNDSGVAVYSCSKNEIVYVNHCYVGDITSVKKYRGYNINAIKLNIQREFFEDVKSKYPPRLVIFEAGFAKFRKEVEALNQINGIIYAIFWDCSQIKYAPTAVKAEIANGKAEKEQVKDVLVHNIPEIRDSELVNTNDNVSDAVAVVVTHLLKEGIYKKTYWNKLEYGKTKTKRKIITTPTIKTY